MTFEPAGIDTNFENYIKDPPECKIGSLLRIKSDEVGKEMYNIKTETWANDKYAASESSSFAKGTYIFVFSSYKHKKTNSILLSTIVDNARYICHIDNFDEIFSVVTEK